MIASVTTSKFDRQVLIEQLRYIEAQDSLAGENDDLAAELAANHDFSARLWLRATRLIERNELMPALQRAAKLASIANGVALLVAAILGALATSLALAGGQTINIYWLLLVLLGFNLLSMLLWLIGMSFKLDGLIAGVLTKITSWLPMQLTRLKQLKQKSRASTAANRAWLACHFGGRVGKWQLSTITHQLWLVYLLSGLVVLVLVLMARQYDFVWGTTLLSDSAFVSLTQLLSRPLQVLGLTTPTAEQVLQTRVGIEHSLSATHSNSWAQFLLGALLVYGILPRLLLWLWAMLMRAAAKRRFALDYYLPYYIGLRQQLLAHVGQGEIDDADAFPLAISSATVINYGTQKVPAEARWVAVELGEDIHWPPAIVKMENDLGQVNDRGSLARVLQRLKNDATGDVAGVIAVAVAAARVPDRGVQRTINSILAAGTQPWLVLMYQPEHSAEGRRVEGHRVEGHSVGEHKQEKRSAIADTRLGAWYRLAEACAVPADHVVIMRAA